MTRTVTPEEIRNMAVELKVPQVGESITEVQIARWLRSEGDAIARDQPLVEIETDKATVELPAPAAGTLGRILKKDGEKAVVGEVIGYLDGADAVPKAKGDQKPVETVDAAASAVGKPEAASARTKEPELGDRRTGAEPSRTALDDAPARADDAPRVTPAARRLLAEQGMRPEDVEATGPAGHVLKEDVLRRVPASVAMDSEDEAVPMSPLRKRVAERLVQVQQTSALLTTFNEVDLSAVIALREEHKETFQARYGVKLGFMSFFVRASVEALKQFPAINAEVRGDDIVYHKYYDVGLAVSSAKGLVVPVLRNADRMSFADIEQAVADFGRRAKENKIALEELQGGTFTITNGGVFGSLLSTPIVNPPQSAILGMHAIQDRPVALEGQVVIRPMMYVALTYDHRIVDGREAVTSLRRIKELVEAPARMLLEV